MSRIGNAPVSVPDGVEVSIAGNTVAAKGPLGQLEATIPGEIAVSLDEATLTFTRPSDASQHKAYHGLARALVANIVTGVSEGFQKALELHGVGYRVQLKGSDLELQVGYSHPVEFDAPDGITFEVPSQTEIMVKGADKQLVGQVAANIRKVRPPEPYKGKGIRYVGEQIRRKVGKAAK